MSSIGVRAFAGHRLDPERGAAFVFDDVDVGVNILLEGNRRHALPGPHAHFEFQFLFNIGDILKDRLLGGLKRQADQIDA